MIKAGGPQQNLSRDRTNYFFKLFMRTSDANCSIKIIKAKLSNGTDPKIIFNNEFNILAEHCGRLDPFGKGTGRRIIIKEIEDIRSDLDNVKGRITKRKFSSQIDSIGTRLNNVYNLTEKLLYDLGLG